MYQAGFRLSLLCSFHTNNRCKVGRLFTAVSIFVALGGSVRPRLIEEVLM